MLRTIVAAAALIAGAQTERPVHWSARSPMRSGDTVRVTLHARIDEFFHLYSTTQGPGGPVRTTVEVVSPDWTRVGKLRVPAPDTIPDGNFGIMSEVYDDSVTFGMTVRGRGDTVKVAVRYQACTTRYCLPARTDTLMVIPTERAERATGGTSAPERMGGGPSTPALRASARDDVGERALRASARDDVGERALRASARDDIATYGSATGLGAFLLLAATMGALALLTPCVFPMIPITVTSFLTTSHDRARGIRQAALYAAGIVASFTGLGLVTSALFGASGLARFAASPYVNLAIAALFAFFALSLLGLVHVRLPSPIAIRLSSLRAGGPLLMGAVFTLTAFTCTAPFVGSLLVMSSQGNWRWPLAGMLVFSAVFAAPFFLLAVVPGILRRQPRAGDWMPAVELTVGAIELGAAIKFLSNADLVLGWGVFTRQLVVGVWIAILIALVGALLLRRGRVRLVLAALTLALAGILVPGFFGRRLGELDAFLPPTATRAATGEPAWVLDDYRSALRKAALEQRPVLIDFTGYTCTNCRWMEANMFPRGDVRQSLDRYVLVRLYTDGLGEPYESQQRMEQQLFGTVALPLYAVVDATGRPRARFLGMTRDAREFVDFLDRSAR